MDKVIKLTKTAIEALPLPQEGKRDVYHFDDYKGLQLRVTPSGSKTFSILRRIKGGALERVTLGKFPDMLPEQAKARFAKINAEIATGASPNEASRALRGEPTLGEMFEEYLERHAIPHGKKTIGEMRGCFRRYLSHWEKRKLSAITRADVQRLHAKIASDIGKRGRGYNGRAAANRTLDLLSAIYNKGIAWGVFRKQNPAAGVEKFKVQSRDRFIQPDELPRFFQALADEPNESIRDYVMLSLLTGARQANILEMEWGQISFERCEWRIPETKNGTPQTIILSPEAVEVLRSRQLNESDKAAKPSKFVFPGDGRIGHLVEPKSGWKRILDRAEIDDIRIHDLRRTLGSWQARTGASLAIIGKSLNHKTASAMAIYARLDLDPVRESVERATSAMMTAAGLKDTAGVVKLGKR